MGGGGLPYFRVRITRILLFRVLYKGPLCSETPNYTGTKCIKQMDPPDPTEAGPVRLHFFTHFIGSEHKKSANRHFQDHNFLSMQQGQS